MILEILLSCLLMSSASTISAADLLKNPSFESPPSNLPPNTTTTTLSTNTTIPGWSFTGTVHYVTAGPNLSLPNGGHAIQLGRGGKINQTFKSSRAYGYVLTFSLASSTGDNEENCSAVAAVNVSGLGYSSVFTIEGRYGRESWESHAFYMLGLMERGLPVDVEIESVAMEGDNPDVLCGPVVDTFVLKEVDVPKGYNDNILINGDFETGPAFIPNSSEGVLLDQDKYDRYSVLQQWSVIGTVKYIDSKHYMVPKGNAAVELVSGPYSGIAIELSLKTSPMYKLSFAMGDTNNNCVGEFVVGVRAGLIVQNFTLQSNGTGHVQNFSMSFNPDPDQETRIEFMSHRQSQTRDLSFCGPVIDNVVLIASDGSISGDARYVFMSVVCLIVVVLNILG